MSRARRYHTDHADASPLPYCRGLRASPHRVAGFATSTGSAGHAGVTTSSQLTFDLDHSIKAAQLVELLPQGLPQLACGAFDPVIFCADAFDFIGGRTRTRTLDPLIKSQLLYQLSYAP